MAPVPVRALQRAAWDASGAIPLRRTRGHEGEMRLVSVGAAMLTVLGTLGGALLSRTRQLAEPTSRELDIAAALRRHVQVIASEPHNIAHYGALQRVAA